MKEVASAVFGMWKFDGERAVKALGMSIEPGLQLAAIFI